MQFWKAAPGRKLPASKNELWHRLQNQNANFSNRFHHLTSFPTQAIGPGRAKNPNKTNNKHPEKWKRGREQSPRHHLPLQHPPLQGPGFIREGGQKTPRSHPSKNTLPTQHQLQCCCHRCYCPQDPNSPVGPWKCTQSCPETSGSCTNPSQLPDQRPLQRSERGSV